MEFFGEHSRAVMPIIIYTISLFQHPQNRSLFPWHDALGISGKTTIPPHTPMLFIHNCFQCLSAGASHDALNNHLRYALSTQRLTAGKVVVADSGDEIKDCRN